MLDFGHLEVYATYQDQQPPLTEDIAFLSISDPIPERPASLSASHLPMDLEWSSLGFPKARSEVTQFRGTVAGNHDQLEQPWDVELRVNSEDVLHRYDGLSGAPLVIGDSVAGVVLRQVGTRLGAISFHRLRPFFVALGIELVAKLDRTLPTDVAETVVGAVLNASAASALENAVREADSGYVLLEGNAGSGKTTFLAMFQPTHASVVVGGRYFVRSDSTAGYPASYYEEPQTFAAWLFREVAVVCGRAAPLREGATSQECTVSILRNLAALAAVATESASEFVLLLDNVAGGHDSFTQCLPDQTPAGVKVVLSVPNAETFQSEHPEKTVDAVLQMPQLPRLDCEVVAAMALEWADRELVDEIAERSHGSPLVLRYLIGDAANQRAAGQEVDVSGPIVLENYYRQQWLRARQRETAEWVLATLARARGRLPQAELAIAVPEGARPGFLAAVRSVRHLLRDGRGGLAFLHPSLKAFVLEETDAVDGAVHAALATYCSGANTRYALTNIVYHHRLSPSPQAGDALQLCEQEWLDRATLAGGKAELLLDDVTALLTTTLEDGDLLNSVRLLMLRARTRFRLNFLFAEFAEDVTKALLFLRGPLEAMESSVRDGSLILPPSAAVRILEDLFLLGHTAEVADLFWRIRQQLWSMYETVGGGYGELEAHMTAAALMSQVELRSGLIEWRRVRGVASKWPDDDTRETFVGSIQAAGIATMIRLYGTYPAHRERLRQVGRGLSAELAPAILRATSRPTGRARDITTSEPQEADENDPLHGVRPHSVTELALLLEQSADEYGVLPGTEQVVALALVDQCRDPEIVARLARLGAPLSASFSIRADNGVDCDMESIEDLFARQRIASYCDDSSINHWPEYETRCAWERKLLAAVQSLARISGDAGRRSRAAGEDELDVLASLRADVLPALCFSLANRAAWEDSYQIPETVVPWLWDRTVEITGELAPQALPDVLAAFLEHAERQLGVYSEGLLASLQRVAETAERFPNIDEEIDRIWLRLRDFSIGCVFHRATRVGVLLHSTYALARRGRRRESEEALAAAVASSNGPEWYKEAQFDLLVTALRSVGRLDFTLECLPAAVALLEMASGEATFERYVRVHKEELIGLVAEQGAPYLAVRLLLHFCYPSSEIQRDRIERLPVDKVSDFEGMRFGVRDVDEQGAVLQLLEGVESIDPPRRWALVEMFWGVDPRYTQRLALQAAIALKDRPPRLVERFRRALCVDGTPKARREFLDEFASLPGEDPSDLVSDVPSLRAARNSAPEESPRANEARPAESRPDDDGLFLPGTFGRNSSLEALRSLDADPSSCTTDEVVDALLTAQAGGWSVWGQGVEGSDAQIALVLERLGVTEGLRTLGRVVLAEKHTRGWKIAATLLEAAAGSLNPAVRMTIYKTLTDHLATILTPEAEALKPPLNFDVAEDDANGSAAEAVDLLLISLLDHPATVMRDRAASLLFWLGAEDQSVVATLCSRVVGPPGNAREIAVGILCGLASKGLISASSTEVRSITDEWTHEENLLVRHGLATLIGLQDCTTLEGSTPEEGSVATDTPNPAGVTYAWTCDAAGLLATGGGTEEAARSSLRDLCDPMQPDAAKALWDVRRRAFDAARDPRGTPLEREAIYRVFGRTHASLPSSLYRAPGWNPEWTDDNLRHDWNPRAEQLLAIIDRADAREFAEAMEPEDGVILHLHEETQQNPEEIPRAFEVTAIILSDAFVAGGLNLGHLLQCRPVHAPTKAAQTQASSSLLLPAAEPAVITYFPARMVGGDLTPARPSQELFDLGVVAAQCTRFAWACGRHWGPWGILGYSDRGVVLMSDFDWTNVSDARHLAWIVSLDGRTPVLVDPQSGSVSEVPL